MAFMKRIVLFLALNFFVILTLSIVAHVLNIGPYLSAYGIDSSSLFLFCLLWGMGGALISLLLSRSMAKWMMSVRVLSPSTTDQEEKNLLETVHRLAKKAHLPCPPEVGIYPSLEVNAFATGPSRKRALVAVSRGILQRMKEEDLEAVLAHEISHVANGDMVTMTLLQGVVNAFVMFLARILAFALSGMGRGRNDQQGRSSGSYFAFVYLFQTIFMILGSLIIAAYSRFREFRADAGGARLTHKSAMIGALQTLRSFQGIRDHQEQPSALAAFKISYPTKQGLFRLFATHPPLEERIERLNNHRCQ